MASSQMVKETIDLIRRDLLDRGILASQVFTTDEEYTGMFVQNTKLMYPDGTVILVQVSLKE